MWKEDTNKQNMPHVTLPHGLQCICKSKWIVTKLSVLGISGNGAARRALPLHFIFFSIALIFPPTNMNFFHNQKKIKIFPFETITLRLSKTK